jgi:ribonuclease HI
MLTTIYTDGGARGNPGPAGIGAVIYNQKGEEMATISKYIGKATNNQAEYQALIAALKKAKDLNIKEVIVYLDSELIVKQINREYRVKDQDLAKLFLEVHNLILSFKKIEFFHIKREKNQRADQLANQAMDKQIQQFN